MERRVDARLRGRMLEALPDDRGVTVSEPNVTPLVAVTVVTR